MTNIFVKKNLYARKVYGWLVLLGYDVTTVTPVTYQRGHLPRPLKEISSCGGFRTYMLSALIPSALSYSAMPLARQQIHQRCVQLGPLVLESDPRKFLTPTVDRVVLLIFCIIMSHNPCFYGISFAIKSKLSYSKTNDMSQSLFLWN